MAFVVKITFPTWLERLMLWPMELYHTVRLGSRVRMIPLSKGKFTIVSREDYEQLNKVKWFVQQSSGLYAINRRAGRTVWMHRVIMNAPDDMKVDHRNNDGLDNRRENLRLASNSENNKNRRKMRGPFTSRYKGVFWNRKRKRWIARIYVNGRTKHIGCFDSELAAARAYDAAARKYHGDFAHLNFA